MFVTDFVDLNAYCDEMINLQESADVVLVHHRLEGSGRESDKRR